jgi:hypothetical protein
MTSPKSRSFVMAKEHKMSATQDAESRTFESGWSKAEFFELEKRWSFLARIGERKAEQPTAG